MRGHGTFLTMQYTNLKKIRVVFNCAASFYGVSLNQMLLQGPDLTQNLLGILLKFRCKPVAVMEDIEKMFYQVRVRKEDCDFLRIFWWPSGNLHAELVPYRMLVHLFGAVSSPACANLALHKTAEDNQSLFPSDTCETVGTRFYVDDLLTCLQTEEEAISLVKDITDLCSRGGFHLTQWSSNSRRVLQQIPDEERSKMLRSLDLAKSELPEHRALGVRWCPELDQFGFDVELHRDSIPTRRSLLSITSSVFDPLGLAAPFTLKAKILQQELCNLAMSWDQPIEGKYLARWLNWLTELPELNKFTIPRYLQPAFGLVIRAQLHHFADASNVGYGVVSYMRFEDDSGNIYCTLLMSRACVNPLKKITVPRLELTAATLAVRLNATIQIYLTNMFEATFFWTDSMSVLWCIKNESSRFKTFVSNRIALITESTEVKQWKYVPGSENPADDVSRGMSANSLLESSRWLRGPSFLSCSESEWPQLPAVNIVDPDVIELRKCSMANVATLEYSIIVRALNYFSSWKKLMKFFAWILVMKECLKRWAARRKTERDQLSLVKIAELENSVEIVKQVHLTTSQMDRAVESICVFEQHRFLMADLPVDRTVIGEPAFSRVGTDYFGPFIIKRGRTSVKRYGVLFTCLVTRAVHLEVAGSLTTDSCINAIQKIYMSQRTCSHYMVR